uniref:NADdependent histone deacetylase sir2like protein putative n=1 Tax=Albugo laibachii Nc14 TaxID=890382 RepID=F0VYW7_9STRA|nr:NADdependent histone deacetylase sir2like protein putative [Albugo laibachii Nc14]|eukprot:CCA13982.1 NADdependent histone deacetylase sir2like protein putative [Albugo laibachii Nc14]
MSGHENLPTQPSNTVCTDVITTTTSTGENGASVATLTTPTSPRPMKKHRTSDDEREEDQSSGEVTTSPYNEHPCIRARISTYTDAVDEHIDGSAQLHTTISGINTDHTHIAQHSPVVLDPSSNGQNETTLQEKGHIKKVIDKLGDDISNLSEDSFLTWLLHQKHQGIRASQMMEVLGLSLDEDFDVDDEELWSVIMSMGIRLIQPSIPARQKLSHVNTFNDVVDLLRHAKKILVLAGAGISVSCGIPDFRSENGIYSRLDDYNLPNPQCMFDIDYFRSNPRPFFAFAKQLFPDKDRLTFVPSKSHYFLKLLEEKGKLSRNIDMLEHAAGISEERSVLCHGSFATATCLACKRRYPNSAIREDIAIQRVPMCSHCGSPEGIIKPDIVFFGEPLPKRFHDSIKQDENEVDLVLVMGSSLKVNPVRSIVGRIRKDAPMILINREPVGRPHQFDVELLGYSDDIVEELCRRLDWKLPHPAISTLEITTEDTAPSYQLVKPGRYMFAGAREDSIHSSDSESVEDEVDGTI